jgi:hypothetical protein
VHQLYLTYGEVVSIQQHLGMYLKKIKGTIPVAAGEHLFYENLLEFKKNKFPLNK